LPAAACGTMLPAMFIVPEADAAAIRTAYEQEGERSAAIEVRRLFPGIPDNAEAREAGNRCPRRLVRLPRYAFGGAGLGRRKP
jgi:hypothetical protein